jgi:DNA repair exonuclease SbcCD nuclease subunit
MSLRVFLTSDLHLGMKFAQYPTAHAELEEERFLCLERMVAEAGARSCDLLVVAGDLFHRVSVSKRDLERAALALRAFPGKCVAVLPGNHDYFSSDDELWPRFREKCGDSFLFLNEQRPYPLRGYDIDACLYPGPCLSIHSATSAVGWVRAAAKDGAVRHHIGVAHGSLEGVSPDFNENYFPMKVADLLAGGLDAWLLGHTHVRYPERPSRQDRIYYPGTPAPDGFDCAHEGSAWLLELDSDREVSAQPLTTGRIRFAVREVQVKGSEDLEALEKEYGGAESAGYVDAESAGYVGAEARRTLLRLRLTGRVTREILSRIGPLGARMAERLMHLELRSEDLREEITREAIDREYPVGSFPHSLLTQLAEAGEQEALRIAHELLQELLP